MLQYNVVVVNVLVKQIDFVGLAYSADQINEFI